MSTKKKTPIKKIPKKRRKMPTVKVEETDIKIVQNEKQRVVTLKGPFAKIMGWDKMVTKFED